MCWHHLFCALPRFSVGSPDLQLAPVPHGQFFTQPFQDVIRLIPDQVVLPVRGYRQVPHSVIAGLVQQYSRYVPVPVDTPGMVPQQPAFQPYSLGIQDERPG